MSIETERGSDLISHRATILLKTILNFQSHLSHTNVTNPLHKSSQKIENEDDFISIELIVKFIIG